MGFVSSDCSSLHCDFLVTYPCFIIGSRFQFLLQVSGFYSSPFNVQTACQYMFQWFQLPLLIALSDLTHFSLSVLFYLCDNLNDGYLRRFEASVDIIMA